MSASKDRSQMAQESSISVSQDKSPIGQEIKLIG